MSRCLPFPPPSYEKNGLSGAALIEHIELERIKNEEKTRKRKEKRDRKHKKSGKSDEGHVLLCSKEERREDGAGNSDGSDMTAEHEQAVVSENLCSDETYGFSMKRGREVSCHGDIGKRGVLLASSGRIIRIKLPVLRHNEHDVATLKSSFASGGQVVAEQWQSVVKQFLANGHGVESSKTCNPVSNATQFSSSGNQLAKREPKSTEGRTRLSKSSFEVLMDNWNLLPFQASLPAGEGNDDWLFNSDSQPKRVKVTPDESSAYSAPGPHGHCLPEIGSYAVPYTVIF